MDPLPRLEELLWRGMMAGQHIGSDYQGVRCMKLKIGIGELERRLAAAA
jgi:hypothetical protein